MLELAMRMDLDITAHVDWDTLEATAKVIFFFIVSSSNKTNNKQNHSKNTSKQSTNTQMFVDSYIA